MMENPKLVSTKSQDRRLSEEKTSAQKISVLDHTNGIQYTTTDKSDGFVIDMESFCHAGFSKQINPNSRIIRSLSRKYLQSSLNDRDSLVSTSTSLKGSCMHETPTTVVVAESTDPATNQQVHHQITVTTGNIVASTENRFSSRRNSCRRSPHPCLQLGPKRIFMLFATLSSLGTILLIYFTWSISKMNGLDQ